MGSEMKNLLFVGESRSSRAKELNVRWEDGALAAKQLFDALNTCGINPHLCSFTNLFERGGITKTRSWKGTVVGLGQKVQKELAKRSIPHIKLIHPAARGAIRKKERYAHHVKKQLSTSTSIQSRNLRAAKKYWGEG